MNKTYSSTLSTPIGTLRIFERLDAIIAVSFSDSVELTQLSSQLMQQTCTELLQYFNGSRTSFSVPLALEGSDFQKDVWRALCEIPYGAVRSYKEIAQKVGRPKASRAVGMANHVNRIPILVPCHRVVGSKGELTGYAGGLAIKRYLLNLEHSFSTSEVAVDEPQTH